jgi:AcrR family transcriptional regulator
MVETLFEATARILVREGYDRASTNRIATEAGVSVGSLYQYFPSKEALVAGLAERLFSEEVAILEASLERLKDASIAVIARELVAAFVESHRANPELRRVVLEQVPRVGRLERMLDVQTHFAQVVRGHLARRAVEVRPKDLEMAAFILVHAVEAVIHSAVAKETRYLKSPQFTDEVTRLITEFLEN